jgi:hypothetical protein
LVSIQRPGAVLLSLSHIASSWTIISARVKLSVVPLDVQEDLLIRDRATLREAFQQI